MKRFLLAALASTFLAANAFGLILVVRVPSAGIFDGAAELPRVTPSMPTSFTVTGTTQTLTDTGNTTTNGTNLQTAIDTAAAADGNLNHEIVLPHGVTFTTPLVLSNYAFALRARSGTNANGTGWIRIRTDGTLPSSSGTLTSTSTVSARTNFASSAAQLAKLVISSSGAGSSSVFQTVDSARHYWLQGLEMTNINTVGQMVRLGSGADQTGVQPHDFIVDRSYIHGQTSSAIFSNCGVALNSGSAIIKDSWIAEFHHTSADTQAVCGWNGTGPYLIENNHLEGAGENVMFGGTDAFTQNVIPSDITIRFNHMIKPASWWTPTVQGHVVKNLFELKVGQRVLVENNVFEHHWNANQLTPAAATQMNAINIKSNNQVDSRTECGGPGIFGNTGNTWATTADVVFRYNIVSDSPGALTLAGNVSNGNLCGNSAFVPPVVGTKRVVLHDDLFKNIGTYAGTTSNQNNMIGSDAAQSGTLDSISVYNITIHSNEPTTSGFYYWAAPDTFPGTNLIWKDNINGFIGQYGIRDSHSNIGSAAISADYGSNAVFGGNIFVGPNPSSLTFGTLNAAVGNQVVSGNSAVGWTSSTPAAITDFVVISTPASTGSTTGALVGADVTTLNNRTANVVVP